MGFKKFIINESKAYLSQRIGDILTALQSLQEDATNLGNRQLVRATEGIVNQIRRILRDNWSDEEKNALKTLQKIGVALAKGMDSNEDMSQIIAAATQELQNVSGKMEEPVNALASPEEEPPEGSD